MRDASSVQAATRADWGAMAKVCLWMDLAIAAGALVAVALGGHA